MGTLIQHTNRLKKYVSGAWVPASRVRKFVGGVWVDASLVRVLKSGVWDYRYSTPDVTAGGGAAASGSGASSSGTVSVGVTATPGGVDSGSRTYDWEYVSGDLGIYVSSNSAQNPTASRDFTGVANGTTSSGVSAVWRCTMTDTHTGAKVYSDVVVGPFTWTNTIPAYGPFTATITSPNGSAHSQTHDEYPTVNVDAGTGPVSGSMTYAWTAYSWGPGQYNSTVSGLTSQTMTVHFDFGVTPPSGQEVVVSLTCVITDTVSGYSYTAYGSASYTYV